MKKQLLKWLGIALFAISVLPTSFWATGYTQTQSALSPEAAARMADVDRSEAAWKSRITAYLAVRSNLDNQEAVTALRNRLFDANEKKRLTAYEK